jgi:hypothetical protein
LREVYSCVIRERRHREAASTIPTIGSPAPRSAARARRSTHRRRRDFMFAAEDRGIVVAGDDCIAIETDEVFFFWAHRRSLVGKRGGDEAEQSRSSLAYGEPTTMSASWDAGDAGMEDDSRELAPKPIFSVLLRRRPANARRSSRPRRAAPSIH